MSFHLYLVLCAFIGLFNMEIYAIQQMWKVFQPLFFWVLFLPHSPSPLFPETPITCYVSLFYINLYIPEVLFFSNIFFFFYFIFPTGHQSTIPFLPSFVLSFLQIGYFYIDLSCTHWPVLLSSAFCREIHPVNILFQILSLLVIEFVFDFFLYLSFHSLQACFLL